MIITSDDNKSTDSLREVLVNISLKISYFVFLFGIVLNWILIKKEILSSSSFYIPYLISMIISLILFAIYSYYSTTNFVYQKTHVPKKYFVIFYCSLLVYVIPFVFGIFWFFFYQALRFLTTDYYFGILIGISMGVILISITLNTYARFKIKICLLNRKKGKSAKTNEDKK